MSMGEIQPDASIDPHNLPVSVPSAIQLICAIAETFGVSQQDAQGWLIQRATEIESAEI
jgi:hypothetical protein